MADPDCLYVNGCSFTYGTELPEDKRLDQCYPAIIAKELNLPLILKADPGSSNQRILRTMVEDIDDLIDQGKHPFVLIGWSEPMRYELCSLKNNDWVNFTCHDDRDSELSEIITSRYNSDSGQTELFLKQLLLSQSFIKERQLRSLQFNMFQTPHWALPHDRFIKLSDRLDNTMFLSTWFWMRSYMATFTNVRYYPGGHPDHVGHEVIAKFLLEQMKHRNLY
jgi:hypothetical protein